MKLSRWWRGRDYEADDVAFRKSLPSAPVPTPNGPGSWRYSRLDGRFVFDYDDGRKGFLSPTFMEADEFAAYVTKMERGS